jgi:hypothetical protein
MPLGHQTLRLLGEMDRVSWWQMLSQQAWLVGEGTRLTVQPTWVHMGPVGWKGVPICGANLSGTYCVVFSRNDTRRRLMGTLRSTYLPGTGIGSREVQRATWGLSKVKPTSSGGHSCLAAGISDAYSL